jgi:hypothetical protein
MPHTAIVALLMMFEMTSGARMNTPDMKDW